MEALPAGLLLIAATWLGLCATAAYVLLRISGGFPLQYEAGFALAGLGLLAIAPCTYLGLHLIDESPSLFASGAQTAGAALFVVAAWRARRARLNPEAAASGMVFAQKSALVVILALGALAINYFGTVWSLPDAAAVEAFFESIALLVILMIIGHVVIAVLHTPHDDLEAPRDERDRAVELYSARNSYYFLVPAFFAVPAILILQLPLTTALNIWFALLLISELIYYASVVAYYRFGTG